MALPLSGLFIHIISRESSWNGCGCSTIIEWQMLATHASWNGLLLLMFEVLGFGFTVGLRVWLNVLGLDSKGLGSKV